MSKTLLEKLFEIALIAFSSAVIVLFVSWFVVLLVKKLFPSTEKQVEAFSKKIANPLGYIAKYTIFAAAAIIFLQLLIDFFSPIIAWFVGL